MPERKTVRPVRKVSTRNNGDDSQPVSVTILRYGTDVCKVHFRTEDVISEQILQVPLSVSTETMSESLLKCLRHVLPNYTGVRLSFCTADDIQRTITKTISELTEGQHLDEQPSLGAILHTLGHLFVILLEPPNPCGCPTGNKYPSIGDKFMDCDNDDLFLLTKMPSDRSREPAAKKCCLQPKPKKRTTSPPKTETDDSSKFVSVPSTQKMMSTKKASPLSKMSRKSTKSVSWSPKLVNKNTPSSTSLEAKPSESISSPLKLETKPTKNVAPSQKLVTKNISISSVKMKYTTRVSSSPKLEMKHSKNISSSSELPTKSTKNVSSRSSLIRMEKTTTKSISFLPKPETKPTNNVSPWPKNSIKKVSKSKELKKTQGNVPIRNSPVLAKHSLQDPSNLNSSPALKRKLSETCSDENVRIYRPVAFPDVYKYVLAEVDRRRR